MFWLGLILALVIVGALAAILFSDLFKGLRTQIAAWLVGILGGVLPLLGDWWTTIMPYSLDIVTYLKDLDWRTYISANKAPYIMVGMGILFYILRRMTTTPAGLQK